MFLSPTDECKFTQQNHELRSMTLNTVSSCEYEALEGSLMEPVASKMDYQAQQTSIQSISEFCGKSNSATVTGIQQAHICSDNQLN